MIKSDTWLYDHRDIITPFLEDQIDVGVLSYGLSSAGYDIRLSKKYLKPRDNVVINPKKVSKNDFQEIHGNGQIIVEGNNFILAESIEYFNIPSDIMGFCLGKSTYARCGILINVTPLEPGWKGKLTIEIANLGKNDCILYSGEGIAQIIFFSIDNKVLIDYSEKEGKYQGQNDITLPKIKE